MSVFYVLSLGEFIREEGINIALESFADLYHNVTSKHQRRMKLAMITKGGMDSQILEIANDLGLEKVLEIVSWSDQQKIETLYTEASVLMLPTRENIVKLISESFSFGLPVICFDGENLGESVDQTCGMLVEEKNRRHNVQGFSEMLRILYFDPEARKILKKGALKKYEELFSWGIKREPTYSKQKEVAEM